MTIVGYVLLICMQSGCANVMLYDNRKQCAEAARITITQLADVKTACVPVFTDAEQEERK